MDNSCVDRLIDLWKTRGVAHNHGVLPAQMKQFESSHHVKLPQSLSDLLLKANGTVTEDERGFRFMPLEEMLPAESFPSFSRAGLGKSFVFVDYLGSSWVYTVDLGSEDHGTVSILRDPGKAPAMVSESIGEFLQMYLADDERLYEP